MSYSPYNMRTVLALYYIIIILIISNELPLHATEVYTQKFSITKLKSINGDVNIIPEINDISRRVERQAFGGYGVGNPYVNERLAQPSKLIIFN